MKDIGRAGGVGVEGLPALSLWGEIGKARKYLDIAESITHFIIKDLHIRKCKNGICFSYTPIDKHIVHNANCLGAAFISRVYKITKDKKLLDCVTIKCAHKCMKDIKTGAIQAKAQCN